MIFIDAASGSKELLIPLGRLVPTSLTHLEFGDIAFEGHGPTGTAAVGIELKKVSELVTSLRTKRFQGHQLPGLLRTYDYRWLLVEGIWKADSSGALVEWHRGGWSPVRGQMTAAELEKTLLTLQLKGGLYVRFANSRADTLRALSSVYRWWTDRLWDHHGSHVVAAYEPQTFIPLSQFRRTACTLPGVGVRVSAALEAAYESSIRCLANADRDTLAKCPITDDHGKSRQLGPATAERILKALNG